MPSNISKSRLQKAFNEGRRSAGDGVANNPYDNPKLRTLWDQGRAKQQSGELTTPIPALEHGQTRAMRAVQNPPRPKRPAPPPRNRPRYGGGGGSNRGQRGRY